MIIARESAAGLDSSIDLGDILTSALPSIGTDCLRSPVKKIDGDKNSSSVSNFKNLNTRSCLNGVLCF